jgi:hypothetical protein
VLITALGLDEADTGGYGAHQAWLYFTILTVGYMTPRQARASGSCPSAPNASESGHWVVSAACRATANG